MHNVFRDKISTPQKKKKKKIWHQSEISNDGHLV